MTRLAQFIFRLITVKKKYISPKAGKTTKFDQYMQKIDRKTLNLPSKNSIATSESKSKYISPKTTMAVPELRFESVIHAAFFQY